MTMGPRMQEQFYFLKPGKEHGLHLGSEEGGAQPWANVIQPGPFPYGKVGLSYYQPKFPTLEFVLVQVVVCY